jgi:hypothetical protein
VWTRGHGGEKRRWAALCPFYRCDGRAARGGQGRGTTRRIEGGGLVPTSGWRPGCVPVDRGPAVAQHSSNWGSAGATDAWAPAGSGTERERRGTGRVGQPGRKKRSGPSPDEQESF